MRVANSTINTTAVNQTKALFGKDNLNASVTDRIHDHRTAGLQNLA
jgi:hypothetical protein